MAPSGPMAAPFGPPPVCATVSLLPSGALPQAFSVFSLQRRAEGKTIGLTPFAYQTDNAIYFVSGRYYVEAVTAMPVPAMMAGMMAMAQQFVAAHPPGPWVIPELLPVSGGKPGGGQRRAANGGCLRL